MPGPNGTTPQEAAASGGKTMADRGGGRSAREPQADGSREEHAALAERLARLHPSDIADIIEGLPESQRVAVIEVLSTETASETLAEMEEGPDRGALLAALAPERGAELVHELADDDAVDLIAELGPDERRAILSALPDEAEAEIRELMVYDDDTAGGLMTSELVKVESRMNAGRAIARVRESGRDVEDFYTVFVVDPTDKLLGTVKLDDLVIAETHEPIESIVEEPVAVVRPDVDQEEVGRLIARYNLAAIPVVDDDGKLLGRITFDDVIDVIEEEGTEDILRLAGVANEDELRHTWGESVRARLPWLLLNLVTAALAAAVILVFEDAIRQVATLAFIAPIIAALGGSSGTQSLAVTIRRLTLEGGASKAALSAVGRESAIGLVNGAALGAGVALLAMLVPGGDVRLGLVALIAMWGNQIVAGFAGAFFPTLLERLGVDPSVASSVFVHTLTDLCGFFLLLGLASRMLMG